MNPDPDSPFSRVERTLISVWCYITEAVSRFLRPQPVETADNDPNSVQETNVDDEAPDSRQTGADTIGEEAGEEQSLQTVSLLSSSSPVVAWDHSTADINVKRKENHEKKEDMRQELFGLTGNDHAVTEGENACQERQEKSEKENCDTYEKSELTENNEEHATVGSAHTMFKEIQSDGIDSRVKEVGHVSKERLHEVQVVETVKEPPEDGREEKREGLEEESKCSSTEEEESNTETGEQRNNKATAVMLGDDDICEDSQQSSPDNENLERRAEGQHLLCKEFLHLAEDEGVRVSDIIDEDPSKSKTDEEPEQKKSSRAVKDIQREEPEISDVHQLHICDEESVNNIEEQASAESKNNINEEIYEEIKEINKLAAAGEDCVSTVRLYGFPNMDGAKEDMEDENRDFKEDKGEDNEDSREVKEENLYITSKEQDSNQETGEQWESKALTVILGDAKICEDALELSSKQENSEEKTQTETQHLLCQELPDSSEDESVQVADIKEEEPNESETNEEPDEKSRGAVIDVQSITESKDDRGIEEKQCGLKENISTKQLLTEDMTGHQVGQEISEIQPLNICVEIEGVENIEDQTSAGSEKTVNVSICEEMQKREEESAAGGNTVSTLSLDGFPQVDEDKVMMDESSRLKEHKAEENEEDFEEERGLKLWTIGEEEESNEETGEQKEGEGTAVMLGDAKISEDPLKLSPGHENAEERTQAEAQHIVCRELSSLAKDEEVWVSQTEEEEDSSKSKTDEESEQKCNRAAEDVQQDEKVFTPNLTGTESDPGTAEEQLGLTGHTSSEQLFTEDMTEHRLEIEKTVTQELQTFVEREGIKSTKDQAHAGRNDTVNKPICEEIEKGDEDAAAGENPISKVCLDGSQIVNEALEDLGDKGNNIQENKLEENEEDFEERNEVKLCSISKEDESNEEIGEQREGKASAVTLEDAKICEDALQLSPEQKNTEERTQKQTQLIVSKQLSSLTKVEMVWVDETEEEDPSKSKTDEEPEQKHDRAAKDVQDENVLIPNLTSSEDHPGTREEEFALTGDDSGEQHIYEDMTGHQDEQEISDIQHLQTCVGYDGFKSKEDQVYVGSYNTGDDAIYEEPEKRDEEDAAGDEPVSTASLHSSPKMDEAQDLLDQKRTIQEDEEKENEQDFEKQIEIKLDTISKEGEAVAVVLKDAKISEEASEFSPERQNGSNERTEDLETQLHVCKEFSDSELIDENIQVTTEGVGQEENVLGQSVTSNENVVQKPEPETATFIEEDVMVTIIQNATDKNVTMEEISTDDDTELAAGERLSGEINNKESCVERVCITTPVTVIAEGESEQEINRGFNNIPLGVIEGQAAQSPELDTEACEETPEAVPEYNNESDENSIQSFLEEGNSEEIQNIDLPEEVGVFKSSGTGGSEYLLIGQGSTEDSKNELGFTEKETTETPRFLEDPEKLKSDNINLELEQLSEEEKVKILDTSMKTEIKQSHEEFEKCFEEETGQQDGAETVEFEIARLSKEATIDGFGKKEVRTVDKGVDFSDETPESLKGEEETMTAISLGPNPVQSFSLQDDPGNLKLSEEINTNLFDESAVKPLQTEFDAEEQGCIDEGELDIISIKTVGMAADQMTGQCEISQDLERNNYSSDRLPEITEAEVTTGTEGANESKLTVHEGFPLISAVEAKHEGYSENSAGEHQNVIDEEILDLWIETVMSNNTDRFKEENLSEPGLQKDQINEESRETSFEKEKQEAMKANSEEPASEASSTALEPWLFGQRFSEKPAETRLLADINDVPSAGSISEDVCEFSTPTFDSALVQETTETRATSGIRSYPDSGAASPGEREPIQECATSQKKLDETKPETELEISAVWGNTEGVPTTKAEDELLEATAAEISDEIQPLESGQHIKDLQTESEKQQFTLVAPEHRWSVDLIKAFSASSRTEVEEDRREVDGPGLDFALQKSRIAVKNPRARPPTDPRSLINMPSVDPTPSAPVSGKVLPGVPLGGLGIGIKLPGLGAGFPVLKKTQPKNEDNAETQSHESAEEKNEEEKTGAAKKDEAPKRPKWMPPGQPGFGNPLMSELKTKLKKTSKD